MADDKVQGFAGLNFDDVKEAVGAVVGSGDDVAAAVAFVREHGDDIVDMVGKLPELLASTSGALSEAADDVGNAAAFLTGGRDAGPGVQSLANVAGDALEACRKELTTATNLLDTVGKSFDALPIPDGGIGDQVVNAAKRFDRVGERLADVAEQLRRLGDAVDSAGHGLANTSKKLEAGGKALSKFSG